MIIRSDNKKAPNGVLRAFVVSGARPSTGITPSGCLLWKRAFMSELDLRPFANALLGAEVVDAVAGLLEDAFDLGFEFS